MTIRKSAAWAATGIIGAGIAGGLTYAAVATPAGASAGTTSGISAAQPTPGAAQAKGRLGGLGRRGLLARLEHGQLTLKTKQGDRTVDLQRGTVSSVSPTSISVTSPDKFAGVYAVTAATKVRTRAGLMTIASVHKGDRVLVVASGGKALRILDRP